MNETQYELFRDLDRRCVAEDLAPGRCAEAVEYKRQLIDGGFNRANPLAADVLAGKTTFTAAYDSFSREFRGLRRLVPKAHDESRNEKLRQLAQIVPNVGHFRRRSWLAADNPVNLTLYGALAGVAIGVLVSASDSGSDGNAAMQRLFSSGQFTFECLMAAVGFVFGVGAMLKYRTRRFDQIHAREAAAYMDASYEFFRRGDCAAWAEQLKSAPTEGGGEM